MPKRSEYFLDLSDKCGTWASRGLICPVDKNRFRMHNIICGPGRRAALVWTGAAAGAAGYHCHNAVPLVGEGRLCAGSSKDAAR
jgi:hypothetical protein